MEDNQAGKCPFPHGSMKETAGTGRSNRDWWPNQLNLGILRQHSSLSNPMEESFNYKEAFLKLDLSEIKNDLSHLMTDSQRLVASRLWSLWSFYDSYGLAQCRNL